MSQHAEKTKKQSRPKKDPATAPPRKDAPQSPDVHNMMNGQALDPLNPQMAQYIQRTMGNQALANMVQREGEQTITFDEPMEVTGHRTELGRSGLGRGVGSYIDNNIVEEMERGWNARIVNYSEALQQFTNFMNFPADKEAKADYVKAALDYGLEQALGMGAGKANEHLKGISPHLAIADKVLGLVQAFKKESERAAAAGSKIKVRDYVFDLANKVTTENQDFSLSVNTMRSAYENEYSDIVQQEQEDLTEAGVEDAADLSTPTADNAGNDVITGAGSEYLNKQAEAARKWHESAPTMMDYMQKILEGWVNADSSTLNNEFMRMYFGGQIYIRIDVELDEDGIKIDEFPTKGKLASGEAEHAVSGLNKLLKSEDSGVDSINDLDIKKNLSVYVEDVKAWYESNDRYQYHLHYREPDTLEHEESLTINGDQNKKDRIWEMIKPYVGPEKMKRIKELETM